MAGAGRTRRGVTSRAAATLALTTLAVLAAGCSLEESGVRSAEADSVDADLVDDCVELVKYQAYVGDARGRAVWERAGSSEDGLRTECQSMGAADPAVLIRMSREYAQLEEFFDDVAEAEEAADAATTEPTIEKPAPGCHPNYGGCVPIAEDVDCWDAGDGPEYVAVAVLVFGSDVYDLDPDEDGLACEATERG